MVERTRSSHFQDVLETVEALPLDEQAMLAEIIQQRVIQQRRTQLVTEIAEGREDYHAGRLHRGTVVDLLEELDE
jgi:hypothetical protein